MQSLTGGALRVPRNDLAAAGRPTRMADTGDSSPLSWADLAEAGRLHRVVQFLKHCKRLVVVKIGLGGGAAPEGQGF